MAANFNLTIRSVDFFFDREAVQKAINKAKRNRLAGAGALVRKVARNSIRTQPKARQVAPGAKRRKRKVSAMRISRPGSPPKQHTRGKHNLKRILFAWDPARESVVVGPVLFKTVNGVKVTEVLEHGGRSTTRRRGKTIRTHVRPRPFMKPALDVSAPKFPDLFKNSVRP